MTTALYYALGGGHGHVTRARRVLRTLGLADQASIVAGTDALADPRNAGGIPTIAVPPELERSTSEHRRWLQALIRQEQVQRLLVDTFPAGIAGELSALPILDALRVDYIGRLLRWDDYRRVVPSAPPPFQTAYVVEELSTPHAELLASNSREVIALDLAPIAAREAADVPATIHGSYSLIVHSGPADEVRELIELLQTLRALDGDDERVLVATQASVDLPDLPECFERIDLVPASALFPAARRIVSAAGFNVMLESEPWRRKHHVLPFARRFDDQFLRAARRRQRMLAL